PEASRFRARCLSHRPGMTVALAYIPQPAKQKSAPSGALCRLSGINACRRSILLEEARKLLLEARHTAAAIEELLGAAGPGRVRFGVDIQVQLVACLAPGRARLVLGAVGHDGRTRMIIRV